MAMGVNAISNFIPVIWIFPEMPVEHANACYKKNISFSKSSWKYIIAVKG